MTTATVAAAAPLCELRAVRQQYVRPNGTTMTALDGIDLEVRPGEVVALLGPSGCGKSTILRILAGLVAPTAGEVLRHGQPLRGLNPDVAFVFQNFALYPWMTVSGNIEAVLRAAGRTQREAAARAAEVVRMVGLAGFESAYPRELSGGMKQRTGIARALALSPELLFLDEPFSQVDALAAESLRAEVIDLFAAPGGRPSAILMVSHDIKEVVYMADRIVVLGANPGRVVQNVPNPLSRPRDYRAPEFLALVDQIHGIITGHEIPDVPKAQPAAVEPLPEAAASEIVGLLEYLDARGGGAEAYSIATDTGREFGRVIVVVQAAEVLGLVDTPGARVRLTAAGTAFVRATPAERTTLWRERLLHLRLFREVRDLAQRTPERATDRDLALETIVQHLPYEDYDRTFQTLVRWARFGDLFLYDEATGRVSLR